MEKCNVCNKTTLLPERLGTAIICKKCLIKIDGLMWKYHNFEKGENLEKFKKKALELAYQNQYPSNVIEEINAFFEQQQVNMKKCEVCNEVKLTTIQMGEATVCKKCFSKISNNWDNDCYFDRKELYEDRDETIKKAKDKNFPDAALKYINEYFEGKVNKNWICTLDGHKEQVLELYDDYLTIKTLDTFDDREMEKCLKTIMSDGHFSKEDLMILKKMGTELLSDILPFKLSRATKGVINSVSNAASEKLSRAAADSKSVSISNFVKTGKRKLLYNSCDNVKLLVSSYEDEVGVLLITSKKKDTSDYLFFFEMQYKDKVNKIKKIITEKIVLNENKKQEEKPSDGSVASEIRQLKGLLDEGLITEAEFEAKKKQLLGI